MYEEPQRLAIPFEHSKHPVDILQGFHGPYTHFDGSVCKSLNLEYAVDFSLPVGALVLAARSGMVKAISTYSCWSYVGKDVQRHIKDGGTNFICLAHDDGTTAVYSHLAFKGEMVYLDQYVEEGMPLARTGLSGALGPVPHLHFHVSRLEKGKTCTIPVSFKDYNGPLEHDEIFAAKNCVKRKISQLVSTVS